MDDGGVVGGAACVATGGTDSLAPSPAGRAGTSYATDGTQTDDDAADSGDVDELSGPSDGHVFRCRICEARGGCSCLPDEPPEEFVCPICYDLMERPLQCVDGHSLCAACWYHCLSKGIGRGRKVCPLDNFTPMKYRDLIPNRVLWSLIDKYKLAHGIRPTDAATASAACAEAKTGASASDAATAAAAAAGGSGGSADGDETRILLGDAGNGGEYGTGAAAAEEIPLPDRNAREPDDDRRLFEWSCSTSDYIVSVIVVSLLELAGVVGMIVLALRGERQSAGLGVCYFGLIFNGFASAIVVSRGAPTRAHLGFACCHWLFITVLGVAIFVGNLS